MSASAGEHIAAPRRTREGRQGAARKPATGAASRVTGRGRRARLARGPMIASSASASASTSSIPEPMPRLARTAPPPGADARATPRRWRTSGWAQNAPERTEIACSSASLPRDLRRLDARHVERGERHARDVVAAPLREHPQSRHSGQALAQERTERELLRREHGHPVGAEHLAGGAQGDRAEDVRGAGLEARRGVAPDDAVVEHPRDCAAAVQQRLGGGDPLARGRSATPAPNGA